MATRIGSGGSGNSNAEVFGGGNAAINLAGNGVEDQVSNSTAIATNGGFADVSNDGLAPTGVTVSGDYALANGTVTTAAGSPVTDSLGTTPSVATVYDSGSSVAYANDTGTNLLTGNGGAAVDLANNSYAEAINPDSAANIIGTGTTAVVGSSNIEPDGDIFNVFTSGTGVFDGIPDATFYADLLGFGGSAAFTADWTILLQAFGL